MDWIATAAGQSRHCEAPAVVCQRSFFNHGVQPWSSFWQSADHAGSRDSNLPFMFFPVETAAGHQKLFDDWCSQDVGTGVRGGSAWLLQQSIILCQRGPPATFAECTECGGKIHHWCKKIRSHLSCVAWSSLVTSATKDNLQDRHFDALVFERFGTSLPGDWLYLNLVDARPKTVCDLQHQDSYTFQEPRQWHLDQGRSRSLVLQSGMICLPVWRILLWAKTLSENCLKHIYLIDDRYFCAFAVFINLRGEMSVMKWNEIRRCRETQEAAGCSANNCSRVYDVSARGVSIGGRTSTTWSRA